jgi:hypothetical protein
MPGDAEAVKPEDFDYSFYPHYYPDPFIAYAGQPTPPAQISADQAAGKLCVRMLGDSTVAASGICQQVEDMLKGRGANASVHNAGVIAANANMMLSAMVHRVVDSRPDITIIVSGGIDVLSPLQFDPRPGYPHIHALKEVFFEHFYDSARSSIWVDRPPLTTDKLRTDYFARLAWLRHEYQHLSPAWEMAIVETYRGAVRKTLALAAGSGLKTVYVLAPLLAFKAAPTATEAATLPPARTMAYLQRVYRNMSLAIAGEAARYKDHPDIRVADLHALFAEEKGEAFSDLIHWTPLGRTAVANALVELTASWR